MQIHNEIGRFFEEKIYKHSALAHRMPGVRLEDPSKSHSARSARRFSSTSSSAMATVFEFKAVDAFSGRHRAQLIQYMMLADVAHGKLINVRPEVVDHEFVNTQWKHAEQIAFKIDTSRWNSTLPGMVQFQDFLTGLMRDLGAG